MSTTRTPENQTNWALAYAGLLALLALAAVAVALLALVVPEVSVELPVTPIITGYPLWLHAGF